jgi:hypothetical protein
MKDELQTSWHFRQRHCQSHEILTMPVNVASHPLRTRHPAVPTRGPLRLITRSREMFGWEWVFGTITTI